jgi:hypothetical protein
LSPPNYQGVTEIDQWKVWAKEMRERRTEIAGLRQTVDEVVLQLRETTTRATAPTAAAPQAATGTLATVTAPTAPMVPRASKTPRGSAHQQRRQVAFNEAKRVVPVTAPLEQMEGVVMAGDGAEEIEEFSDMEGVEREGLFASKHAPAMGEAPPTLQTQEKREGKGKGKEVTPAVPRSILKRPEMQAAEKAVKEKKEAEERKKAEEKEVARKRWEDYGKMTEMEQRVYDEAAGPIKATTYEDESSIADAAAIQRVAHKAGIRALQDRWEEKWQVTRAQAQAPPRRIQQQQNQQQRQQVQPQQRVQVPTARTNTAPPPRGTNWAQRAAAAAPLPQQDFARVGKNGKVAKATTGLEPLKKSIPWDERMIVFERAREAPPVTVESASSVIAQVNLTLSKVAPPHIRTMVGKISSQGRLSTSAREGASAAMLLSFKKEIIEAARRADKGIINVMASESWMELKIFVPYSRYRHPSGLEALRNQIEAENDGVMVPPFSMRWMRAKRVNEEKFRLGKLPQGGASVTFKVPNRAAGQKLLSEMWVAGNRFKALLYSPDRADVMCSLCCSWGHSEFSCQQGIPSCSICAGSHRTEAHRCEVATCGRVGKVCSHSKLQCANCGGNHPAMDGRCRSKAVAIAVARGARTPGREARNETTGPTSGQANGRHARSLSPPRRFAGGPPTADWTEEEAVMETVMEVESSGTAPPVAA